MWENTPDGRPGWQMLALQEGYSTYLTDAIGKGRASWARWPEVFKNEPAFRPNEETWPLLRIGQTYTEELAGRKSFANTAFPVEAFDDFAKSSVPRFPGQDSIEMTAYEQLIQRICPCVVVAQSSGGYFATQLALKRPDLIKAIVTVELTAAPDLSKLNASAITNVPQLILWGDNWKENPTWMRIRGQIDAYVASLAQKNAKIRLVDLPSLGIVGNTHQMMVDRNNEAVLRVAFAWLDAELSPGGTIKK
ncbi:esterase [Polaromonas sp. P1(28)-8]|nr:esterase [Polaromonas sp. P1(28)-8]